MRTPRALIRTVGEELEMLSKRISKDRAKARVDRVCNRVEVSACFKGKAKA